MRNEKEWKRSALFYIGDWIEEYEKSACRSLNAMFVVKY